MWSTASAQAASKVGEFQANGFIFKDSVETVAVEDPDGMLTQTGYHACAARKMIEAWAILG